jgi:putative Mn2+ efflux pump MntP
VKPVETGPELSAPRQAQEKFALSLLGVFLGHRFKALARSKSKAIGGVILILIGTKILFEHLVYF